MLKQGFSLIESLIYILASTILFFLVIQVVYNYSISSQKHLDKLHITVSNIAGFENLIKNLRLAKSDKSSWFVKEKDRIVFKSTNEDFDWYVKNSKLYCTKGIFNATSGKWIKKKVSLVMEKVASINFTFIEDGESVNGILVTINYINGDRLNIENKNGNLKSCRNILGTNILNSYVCLIK